jgi:hypothetical protein
MEDWLNRIGMTLQFIALFLVTPEILGEEKVVALARTLWVRPSQKIIKLFTKEGAFTVVFWIIAVGGTLVCAYALSKLGGLFLPDNWWTRLIRGWIFYPVFFIVVLLTGFLIDGLENMFLKIAHSKRSFLPVGTVLIAIGFVLMMWATFV